jgi:hypothetical protein
MVVMLLQEQLQVATEGNMVLLLIDIVVDPCLLLERLQESGCSIFLQEKLQERLL